MRGDRRVIDIVQEDGSAVSELEQSALLRVSAGKCPTLMAEKFAFYQLVWQRGQRNGYKRAQGPRAHPVNVFGEQLFADTGLPNQENGGIRPGCNLGTGNDGLHPRIGRHNSSGLIRDVAGT